MVRGIDIDKLALKSHLKSKKRKNVKFAEPTKKEDGGALGSAKRRRTTVWDAVAGRVGPNGWLDPTPIYSKRRDKPSSSTRPISAEDIYYSRKNSGPRTETQDEELGEDELPPSDLSNALHRYASRWFARPEIQRKYMHTGSLDFSAMLALGILLDETIEGSLGETGHLAFVEGEPESGGDEPPLFWNGRKWVRSVLELPKKKSSDATNQDGSESEISLDSNGSYENEEHPGPKKDAEVQPGVRSRKPSRNQRLKKVSQPWEETQARIRAVDEALRMDREGKRKAEEFARKGLDLHYSSRSASPSKRARVQPSQTQARQKGEVDNSDGSLEDQSRNSGRIASSGTSTLSLPIREQSVRSRTKRFLSQEFVTSETSSDSETLESQDDDSNEINPDSRSEEDDANRDSQISGSEDVMVGLGGQSEGSESEHGEISTNLSEDEDMAGD